MHFWICSLCSYNLHLILKGLIRNQQRYQLNPFYISHCITRGIILFANIINTIFSQNTLLHTSHHRFVSHYLTSVALLPHSGKLQLSSHQTSFESMVLSILLSYIMKVCSFFVVSWTKRAKNYIFWFVDVIISWGKKLFNDFLYYFVMNFPCIWAKSNPLIMVFELFCENVKLVVAKYVLVEFFC